MVSGKAQGDSGPEAHWWVVRRGGERPRTKPESIFSSLKRGWALCNKTL